MRSDSQVLVRVENGRVVLEPIAALEAEMWTAGSRGRMGDATESVLQDRLHEVALEARDDAVPEAGDDAVPEAGDDAVPETGGEAATE